MTTINDLQDWTVTFPMQAGDAKRSFTVTIPAADSASAEKAAVGIALSINEATGHVWKVPGDWRVAVNLAEAVRG